MKTEIKTECENETASIGKIEAAPGETIQRNSVFYTDKHGISRRLICNGKKCEVRSTCNLWVEHYDEHDGPFHLLRKCFAGGA